MSVAVLIPWRGGCDYRARALAYVQAHHEFPVVLGTCSDGPWIKATAVADALRKTTAQTLVIADADVWVPGVNKAIELVQAGAPWAMPHRSVVRLSKEATVAFLAGADWPGLTLDERIYQGVEGGGCVVIDREIYNDCPLDERFTGWGSEDESWGWALRTLHGRPQRVCEPLIHLFHPPQERMTRTRGSLASWQLRKRYARALNNPTAMTVLTTKEGVHAPTHPA